MTGETFGYLSYKLVARWLNLDELRDILARNLAWAAVKKCISKATVFSNLDELKGSLKARSVIVVGPGPSAEKALRELCAALCSKSVLVVADSAYSTVKRLGLRPDVVVTDLDGISIQDLLRVANESFLAIHVHGDNIDTFLSLICTMLRTSRGVLLTTQLESKPPLKNIGGFTDGDRAVILGSYLADDAVHIVGMDFTLPLTKAWHSDPLVGRIKRQVALRILESFLCEQAGRLKLYNYSYTPLPCTIKGSASCSKSPQIC
uniref:DUF115 domain-containing protein n=1 Tax=Fervidicoccus fontis TaxID=683846 RepID=A0A7J3ZLT3_9CREN